MSSCVINIKCNFIEYIKGTNQYNVYENCLLKFSVTSTGVNELKIAICIC